MNRPAWNDLFYEMQEIIYHWIWNLNFSLRLHRNRSPEIFATEGRIFYHIVSIFFVSHRFGKNVARLRAATFLRLNAQSRKSWSLFSPHVFKYVPNSARCDRSTDRDCHGQRLVSPDVTAQCLDVRCNKNQPIYLLNLKLPCWIFFNLYFFMLRKDCLSALQITPVQTMFKLRPSVIA